MITEKNIKITRTKSGVPCLWESLTTFENLKRATVILDKEGRNKKCFYYNDSREKQALVPIAQGDLIVKAFQDDNGIALSLFKINTINPLKNEAEILPIYRKSSLSNDEIPSDVYPLIQKAIEKLNKGTVYSIKAELV
jgi:hypothetical protein